jgi:hypothetical protein
MEASGGPYRFREISLRGDRLTFSWTPEDKPVYCDLKRPRSGGRFAGSCKPEEGGDVARLKMVPPPDRKESDDDEGDEDRGDDTQTRDEKPKKKGTKE